MRDFSPDTRGRVAAILGPTNTGKTHYAIERMLAHRTGVIGLPLRLLAREVYDKIVALRGPSVVALVTGEERIVPERTQYWVCTVEAMPLGNGAISWLSTRSSFAPTPSGGMSSPTGCLHARACTRRCFWDPTPCGARSRRWCRAAQFMRRDRMSELTHVGSKKVSRMPPRSAIVGFSVENLYAMAELLRRQKGGAAVVMGALSPRTRNAQVELYQNGDVDVLVATDAIGMGLNLDIKHVAFSGLRKFDGRKMRELMPERTGADRGARRAAHERRHLRRHGRGPTARSGRGPGDHGASLRAGEAALVAQLRPRVRLRLALIASLEERTEDEWLTRGREADDLMALKALAERAEVSSRIVDARDVRLLWDVCRIPDFRGISHAEHADLLGRIFGFLHDGGRVPDDWLARQVRRIDRTDGDIDTLSKRLAYIRTWTYVAQRTGWVEDESHWRGATRAVEDRLSDALHGALTQRFVDRRTSVLLRRLKQKESLVAEVTESGEVTVEGQVLGRIDGFRFRQDDTASPDEAKTLRQAAMAALRPEFHLRADRLYNAPDTGFDMTEEGGLLWGETVVGRMVAGPEAMKPTAEAFVEEDAGAEVILKVQRRLQHFVDRKIAAQFEPLMAMARDEAITGLARGVAFRLVEGYGIVPRSEIADDIKALDQDARGLLRKHGVRFGQFTIFMPLLLKPAPTRLRLVLWGLEKGLDQVPESPPPGLVTIPHDAAKTQGYYAMSGYRPAGSRAIRIDMLERLADMLRGQDTRGGFEATADMLSITGLTLEQFADLMGGLGYKAERGERAKVKSAPEPQPTPEPAATDAPETVDEALLGDAPPTGLEGADTPDPTPPEVPVETPTEAPDTPPQEAPADTPTEAPADAPTEVPGDTPPEAGAASEPETEVFYTFAWAPRRRGGDGAQQRRTEGGGGKPRGQKPKGGKPRGKGGKGGNDRQSGPKTYSAKPDKPAKVDPDNPFAVLAALKDKS
jgi:ATP-dependent RNA helicase SUPV3L1/SUV3